MKIFLCHSGRDVHRLGNVLQFYSLLFNQVRLIPSTLSESFPEVKVRGDQKGTMAMDTFLWSTLLETFWILTVHNLTCITKGLDDFRHFNAQLLHIIL